jgi:uncharacterized protein
MNLTLDASAVVALIRERIPGILGIYAFGSRVNGTSNQESDLDLAVLVEGYADSVQLWELTGPLADLVLCPVDLLDFRAASTVMQHQILTTGTRLFVQDVRADLFEVAVLSEKTNLDEATADLIADITRSGSVYGR